MKLIGNPIQKHEGTPLKTLLFLAITSFRKEKIITKFGLEEILFTD
jgi:hypothetical protein